ncbi:MAG: cation:proton antiporter [Alphaproteobacteria bacterium]
MPDIALLVIAVALLLFVAAMLQPLATQLSLPHTVLLAVFGLVLGGVVVAGQTADPQGFGGEMLRALGGIALPSDALTYLFLPTLLFEAGLALNVRRLLDDFWAIFVLAVVAVVVTTMAIGFSLGLVADLALAACLLLGAIVATSDPSAVVGLFRDVGAPRRLGILVEGESLLNDAAAIALFAIFFNLTLHLGETVWPAVLVQFSIDLGGGLLVGIGCAWIACLILPRLYGLRLAEITVTLALAYLSYAVAETAFGVSGVVSVVAASLFIGSYGRTRIDADTWVVLIDVWQQLNYWASGLVFVLAAMAMPQLISTFDWQDVLLLGVMVVAAFAARGAVLLVFFPLIARFRLGKRLSSAYLIAIWWGGVRGALTLALALAVTEHPEIDAETRTTVATLATGFVLFTLFVNATTLPMVIRWLGLTRLSAADRLVRVRAIDLALNQVQRDLRSTGQRYNVEAAISQAVCDDLDLRREQLEGDATSLVGLSLDDRIYIGLTALAAQERQIYEDMFAKRIMSRHTNRALLAFSGRLADAVKTGGLPGYQAAVTGPMLFSPATWAAVWVNRRLRVGRLLARVLADRYEMLLTIRVAVRDLMTFSGSRLSALIGAEAAERLDAALSARQKRIATGLDALELQYPDYTGALKALQMHRVALRLEDGAYRALYDDSMISQEVYNTLMRDWRLRWARSERRPSLDVSATMEDLIKRVPLFAALDVAQRRALASRLRARLFLPGERIVTTGERGAAMYFLLSGAVEVAAGEAVTRLGSGDFFGEIALVFNRPRTADVTALGYCEVLMLRDRDFSAFLSAHPELRRQVTEVARQRLSDTLAGEQLTAGLREAIGNGSV